MSTSSNRMQAADHLRDALIYGSSWGRGKYYFVPMQMPIEVFGCQISSVSDFPDRTFSVVSNQVVLVRMPGYIPWGTPQGGLLVDPQQDQYRRIYIPHHTQEIPEEYFSAWKILDILGNFIQGVWQACGEINLPFKIVCSPRTLALLQEAVMPKRKEAPEVPSREALIWSDQMEAALTAFAEGMA